MKPGSRGEIQNIAGTAKIVQVALQGDSIYVEAFLSPSRATCAICCDAPRESGPILTS